MPTVPFANHQRTIARLLQNFGESHVIAPRLKLTAEFFPDLVAVESCQKGGARGHTDGVVVKMSEPNPFLSQPVQVGGVDFTTVTTQITKAQVVCHDENDVRSPSNIFPIHDVSFLFQRYLRCR